MLALQHSVDPTDVPSILFRKHGDRYDELSELSVGQKCTALLIIALCDGTMPVIIDQPEDALDIVSVWEDVAKKLRRGKETRQFILTTHHPQRQRRRRRRFRSVYRPQSRGQRRPRRRRRGHRPARGARSRHPTPGRRH